jgi:(p)ppGpp synthase/HD superfamily hydrolase
MNEVELAKRFADIAHYKQKYGTNPYTYHLKQVEMVLNRFGFTNDVRLQIAAWLHDIIEDTPFSYDQVKHGFGPDVADIVYAVTNEMGRNRKERYAKTYPKIRANPRALALKLADRIANIEFSKGTNTEYINMYKKEMPFFEEALYEKSDDERIETMWQYLKSLFKIKEKQ